MSDRPADGFAHDAAQAAARFRTEVATGDRFELVDRLGKDRGVVAVVIVRVNSGPVIEIEAADFIDALMTGNLKRLHSHL